MTPNEALKYGTCSVNDTIASINNLFIKTIQCMHSQGEHTDYLRSPQKLMNYCNPFRTDYVQVHKFFLPKFMFKRKLNTIATSNEPCYRKYD